MHAVSALLNDSILLVRETCPEDEFVRYRRAIGQVMGELYTTVLAPLYRAHPAIVPDELKAYFK